MKNLKRKIQDCTTFKKQINKEGSCKLPLLNPIVPTSPSLCSLCPSEKEEKIW